MVLDVVQLVATGLASAAGAAIAAAIGLRYGIARFRKERAIDHRLAWHESSVRELVDGSGKIIRAVNASRSPHLAAERESAWKSVGDALGRLLNLESEAEMFASNAAYHALAEAIVDVRATIRGAQMLSERPIPPAEQGAEPQPADRALHMYEITSKLLLHAASRFARDVRQELELEELTRDWRLYDDELSAHLESLNDGRSRAERNVGATAESARVAALSGPDDR